MYFDARAAKALQPGGHIVVDGCPGLRLVANGSKKTWVYRYKSPVTGQMKQARIGHWPAMPPFAAATNWQALRDRRDAGEDPALEKKTARQTVKSAPDAGYALGAMIEDYASGYLEKNREAKGARAVAQRLRNAIKSHENLQARKVSRRFVFDLIESLSDRPVLAGSVKTEIGAAWEYALDAGRIADDLPNWWRLVSARKLRSKGAVRGGRHKGAAKRTLSEAELRTLLTSDLARFSQQVQDFLTIQLWTCTRGAEIVQMHANQVTDEKDGVWWTVPKELTKGRHNPVATDLRVPLIGKAMEIVERLREGGGWLFPSTSRSGVAQHQVQAYMQSKVNYLQPYCKSRPDHVRERLGVTHWSPHDLRRTGRTMLAAMGCPNEVGEAILGHVQPGVIGTYNLHQYNAERRQWLAALDARLSLICG